MQLHKLFEIAEAEISLLSEGVMTSLSEVLGAQFYFGNMLLPVEVSADFHDSIKVVSLAVNFDSLLMLSSLNIEVSRLFPVVRIAFELGLLNKDLGIKQWSFTSPVLSVLSDQLISFRELLELSVQVDCFIKHLVLNVILGCLLEFALECKDFRLKPCVVQVVDLLHLVCSLAQVDKSELSNMAESLSCNKEVLG